MSDNHSKNKGKVVVGMSGGVDSSVVALLLKQQGYEVVGLHMKSENQSSAKEDEERVQNLCKKLGIELHVVEYSNEMQIVKDYFINEYLAGRTPNPCVVCNKEVKFKPFIEFAKSLDADFYATGHYAQIEHNDNEHLLKLAKDENKDQTYFLCGLSAEQLKNALFPLGALTKPEVRKIAEENGLISAHTKDSYDVCFLGSQKFKDYMQQNHPEKEGDIVDALSGKVVGKHSGISKYTLGQRKGLGIGGGHGTSGEPWFVSNKDTKNNVLYVAQGNDDVLFSSALISNNFNWLKKPEQAVFECNAKFRYRQPMQKVKVEVLSNNKVLINFKEKQKAVTNGQFAVLYAGSVCLGGGVIDEVIKN